jgi:hypothetical protein
VRTLVFALEFRGKAWAVPGTEGGREARTTASTDRLASYAGGEWLRARMESTAAEPAVLEARVQRFGDGTFVEEGTIAYGPAGTIAFETVGRGWVEAAPAPDTMVGAVVWRVVEGKGGFTGAEGLITSNFTVTAAGDVTDTHVARIYVP